MYSIKDLHKFSHNLNVLYIEDDKDLREETTILLKMLFKDVDTAEDGQIGLNKYNQNVYDLVISDVNMPNMNGIEMCKKIKEINAEQKISIVSAHDESAILIDLIKAGADGFILKPMHMDDLITALYPICRDAYTQIVNIELVNELNEKNELLEEQIKKLRASDNTIETKHKQLGALLKEKSNKEESDKEPRAAAANVNAEVLNEYFKEDEDDGVEKVVFLPDHCADLSEIFMDIPDIVSTYIEDPDNSEISKISSLLVNASSILVYYSPYLDMLATSFSELATALENNQETFINILRTEPQSVLMLFDAVSADMERYIERFSVESLAMKNAHHIHEPTALSIQQIITLIQPPSLDEGDMDDIFDF